MLRALLGGFVIGPVLLVVAMLLWSKAGLAVLIMVGVLFCALVAAVLATASTGHTVAQRRVAAPTEAASTPKRVDAGDNPTGGGKWRQAFMGWRYGPTPDSK